MLLFKTTQKPDTVNRYLSFDNCLEVISSIHHIYILKPTIHEELIMSIRKLKSFRYVPEESDLSYFHRYIQLLIWKQEKLVDGSKIYRILQPTKVLAAHFYY